MNIRDVHTSLASILDGLAITEPVGIQIVRVWPFLPPENTTIAEPTIVMYYDLTRTDFQPGGMVQQDYDIHLELYATRALVDRHVGAAIASSFMDELVTVFSAHQRLGGAVQVVRDLRGNPSGQGTMTILENAHVGWVGLDLVIPITLKDTRTRAA